MRNEKAVPLVVGFVSDLMFASRIDNVGRHLGFRVEWIATADKFGEEDLVSYQRSPGEPLEGSAGRLLLELTRWQPSLLLFDLANKDIPWRRWIPLLKSSPASSRMPILCFGPHVDVETMKEAERAGADVVLPRSRFNAAMPHLLQQHALIPDYERVQSACEQPLSTMARQGIDLHNSGQYFEAHEALEEAWMQDEGPGRDLYRALLQISVAFLQIERGNYRGAVKMCLRVRQWLAPLPAICRGVDVEELRDIVEAIHETLLALGPGRVDEFEKSKFRPFALIS